MIRLLLQKQSDLGLGCLCRFFGKQLELKNICTFTVGLDWSGSALFVYAFLGRQLVVKTVEHLP